MLARLLCISLTAVAPLCFAEDWPRWRGPDLNGISAEKNWFAPWPNGSPRQVWKASVGLGMSSISVANEIAVTMGNEGDQDTVWCFDANDGKLRWKHTYASPLDPNLYEGGPSSTPTIEAGTIYTLSKDGHLYALAAADGKPRWHVDLLKEHGVKKPEWGFASSPLIIGERLFVNAGGAGACFNKATGKLMWLSSKEPAAYATPVPIKFGGREALMFQASREVVAVAQDDGERLWGTEWKTSYDTSSIDIIPVGSKVFISSYRHPAVVIDVGANPPKQLWENKEFWQHMNTPTLVNGVLYGFHGDGRHDAEFKAVHFETGQTAWTAKNLPVGSNIAADGKLILLTGKGELIVAEANPEKYVELARAQILGGKCWTSPTLVNGKIYARNVKGDLVCVATK